MFKVRVTGAAIIIGSLMALFVMEREPEVRLLTALVLAAGIAVFNLLPLALNRGGRVGVDVGAAVGAIILLSPGTAALAVLLGSAVALILVKPADAPRMWFFDLARRVITVYGLALLLDLMVLRWDFPHEHLQLLLLGSLVGAVYALVDIAGFLISERRHGFLRIHGAFSGIVRTVGALYLSQISIAIVMVLIYPGLGVFAIFILLALMVLMQHSFNLLLGLRAAYIHTISVLARIPEIRYPNRRGHAERTAELSALIGRQLGLSGDRMERLTTAALLHDIGRLGLESKADGSVSESPATIASRGAEMLSKVEFLSDLAPVLLLQSGESKFTLEVEVEKFLLAQIVRAASHYDDLAARGVPESERISVMRQRVAAGHSESVLSALETGLAHGGRR